MEEEMQRQIELFTKSNSLPKIDLRVSLTGSIRKTTLMELLPPEYQSKLEHCLSKIDPETPFIFSDLSSNALKDINTVKKITKEILEDWNKHNVIYMELLTNLLSKPDKYTKEEYLLSVLEEIDTSNKALNQRMTTRLILCLDRSADLNEYENILKIYQNISNPELKKLIVGIDYSGIEKNKHQYKEIIPIFEKFRGEGLGVTVHIGENPNYLPFPFDLFVPDRVSHGIFLKQEHINQLIQKNIPIEICPTYSYKINRCTDYSRIPMANLWKKKYKNEKGEEVEYKNICLNSDVRTLIFTDISQEYYEIGIAFNLGLKDLKAIEYNSLNFIFEKNEEIKSKLKTKLDNYHC